MDNVGKVFETPCISTADGIAWRCWRTRARHVYRRKLRHDNSRGLSSGFMRSFRL